MLPIRYNRTSLPNPMQLLRNDLDDVFQRFWPEENQGGASGVYPMDIHEDADNFFVEAELPGFTKDQVSVRVEDGVLSISAERKEEALDENTETHLRERRFTKVQRRISLPSGLDTEKVEAELKEGVLYLTLAKSERVKPKQISIN